MAMNSTQGLNSGGKAKYTFALNRFKGVDFTSNPMEINESRSPDMVNMMPGANGSLKCRNGYEKVIQAPGRINGIYSLSENKGTHIIIHHGTNLSEWDMSKSRETSWEYGITADLVAEAVYYFVCDGTKIQFTAGSTAHDGSIKYDLASDKLSINDVEISHTKPETASGVLIAGDVVKNITYPYLKSLSTSFPDHKSTCQQMGNKLYIFTGSLAYVYGEWDLLDDLDNKTGTIYEARKMEDEAYTPTVLIGRAPLKSIVVTSGGSTPLSPTVYSWADTGGGGGTAYEDINLISPSREEDFLVAADSAAGATTVASDYAAGDIVYHKLPLSVSPISSVTKVEKLLGSGVWAEVPSSGYTADTLTGIVTMTAPLDKTPVVGRDNYRVVYSVSHSGTIEEKQRAVRPTDATAIDEGWKPDSWDVPAASLDKIIFRKYRFLLDKNLLNAETTGIVVGLNFPSGRKFYNGEKYETVYQLTFTVTDEGISGANGCEARIVLPSGEYATAKHDTDWQARIYAKLVKVGETWYLDVSEPYCGWTYDGGTSYSYANTADARAEMYYKMYYSITTYAYKDRINKATLSTKFGYAGNLDRLFVAGYEELPEYEFWSKIDNPLYFPDLNYAVCGDRDTRIMGWSRLDSNQLAIHKNSNGSDQTIFVQSSILKSTGADFPVTDGSVGEGVISSRCFGILNGEPLALSGDSVFATKIVSDIPVDVKYAANRSYYIGHKLKGLDLKNAEAIVKDGKYYLAVGGEVFIADGNQKAMIGGNKGYEFSYEWYYWNNIPCRVWWIHDDELYFGSNDGTIYRFNDGYYDDGNPVECYWCSKPMNFNQPTYYKKIKNMYVTVSPYEWSEVNVDYITDRVKKTVKNYSVHSYDRLPITIATNYKATKIEDVQFKVWAHNAEPLEMLGMSAIYTVGGKYKGV